MIIMTLLLHIFPALIKKIHEAKIKKKKYCFMGNGKAKREIMYVDDLSRRMHSFYEC